MIARANDRIGLGVLQLVLVVRHRVLALGMARGVMALAALTAAVVGVTLYAFRRGGMKGSTG
jgi:hypothetical protein